MSDWTLAEVWARWLRTARARGVLVVMGERTGLTVLMLVALVGCQPKLPSQGDETRTEKRAADAAGDSEAEDRVEIVELEQVSDEPLTLDPPHFVTTTQSGEARQMPVVMAREVYQVRAQIKTEDDVKEWSGRLRCFNLRSTDPEMPYSYSFWAPYILGMHETYQTASGAWPGDDLRLFSLGGNEKTLVGGKEFIWWMDVSQPNEKTATLKGYLLNLHVNPPQPHRFVETAMEGRFLGHGPDRHRYVPVTAILGLWPFARHSGPARITLEEVSRNGDGHLVVGVTGIKSDKLYTLIFDGKSWRTE